VQSLLLPEDVLGPLGYFGVWAVPVLALLVQVLQGLGPVLLGLVPEQVQALVALLGPEPVLALQALVALLGLLVQVVPAQGGLRVVGVLAACVFTS